MAKKHVFSAHSDLKTGFFSKLFLILGGVLLLVYLIELTVHPIGLGEDQNGTILAFAILCIGLGLISYFFSCQFSKLSKIAEEIESDESLIDTEETDEEQ